MKTNILQPKARFYLILKRYIVYLFTMFMIIITLMPAPVRCQFSQAMVDPQVSTESTSGKQFSILGGFGSTNVEQVIIIGSAPKTIIQKNAIDPSKNSANITDIQVHDTYAYVIEDSSTLHILDIEKPDDPRLLRSLTNPNFKDLKQIWVTEGYLYLTDSGYGIWVVDISSDTSQPSLLIDKGLGFPIRLYVKEETNKKIIYSILWEEELPGDPNIIPSTNRSYILILNHEGDKINLLNTPIVITGNAFDLSVKEFKVCTREDICETTDILYVATGDKVRIYDVTDPNNPTDATDPNDPAYKPYIENIPIGSSNIPPNIQRILINEDTLYMADRYYGIHIADLSVPKKPQINKSLELQGEIKDIYLCGPYALVVNGLSGIQVINLYEEENRLVLGNIYTFGDATSISSYNHYIYVANGNSGLSIVDAPSLVHPNLRAYMNTNDDIWAINYHEDHAYISNGGSGLKIIKTRPWDPNVNPTEIRDTDTRLVTYSLVKKYNIMDIIYLADETKLKAYDTRNISNPINIVNFQDTIMSIFIQGNYAYLANFLFGAQSLNIIDPRNIKQEGYIFSEGLAYDIIVDEDKIAYLANDQEGLWIVDFQKPFEPVEKSRLTQFDFAHGIEKYKNFIYMTNGSIGIELIEVSNPSDPNHKSDYTIDYNSFLFRVYNIIPPFNDFLKDIDIESDDIDLFPFLYTAGDYHGLWINYLSPTDCMIRTIDFITLPYGASAVKSDRDRLYCGDDYGNFYIFSTPVNAIIDEISHTQIKFRFYRDLPAGYYDIFLLTDNGVESRSNILRKGLHVYQNKVTFHPGLNILSYPGLVSFENARAFSLLKNLSLQEGGSSLHIKNIWMRKTDSETESFQVAYMNKENPAGDNFDILPLRGYLIYAQGEQKKEYLLPRDTLNLSKAELIERLKSKIRQGQNLISLPLMQDFKIKSSDLVSPESQPATSAIQEWDVTMGKWHSGYSFFNKVNGRVKNLTGGNGYLVSVSN